MRSTGPNCSGRWVEPMRRFVFVLRWGTLLLAAALLLLVGLGWLISPREPESLPERILYLFATDDVVQRTAVFCALGLLATAMIFFRVRPNSPPRETAPPPPSEV